MTMSITTVATTAPPSVDIGVTSLPSGTASVLIERLWESTSAPIRDDGTVAGLTGHAVDYDAPVGRPMSWRVTALSASGGTLEQGTSWQVTIAAPAAGWCWISDPMAPRGAMLLPLAVDSDAVRSYAADVKAVPVSGASTPQAIGGVRQVASDWPLIIGTDTAADAAAFEVLISGGQVLLLRADPATMPHRTGVVFLAVPTFVRHNYLPAAFVDWEGSGFEALGPAIPSAVVSRAYSDLKAAGGTYATLKSAWSGKTYLDLARG